MGGLEECDSLARKASSKYGWPNITTNSESNPYSTQGSKTTAFEICSQLKWGTPDWLLVPFGGGGNLYGHYLGFEDFRKLDMITGVPHLVAVQAAGCAPFVKAFKQNRAPDQIEEWINPETIASGIRVPYPYDGELALPAISKSNGSAETVTDQEILEAELRLARTEGIFAEPSAASSIAGLRKLVDCGTIEKNDVVVCEITGTGLKNPMSAASLCREQATIPPALDEFDRILRVNQWSGKSRKTEG
jgi:threonine synthase